MELIFLGNATANQHTPGEMSGLVSEDPTFNRRVKLPSSTLTQCEQPLGTQFTTTQPHFEAEWNLLIKAAHFNRGEQTAKKGFLGCNWEKIKTKKELTLTA